MRNDERPAKYQELITDALEKQNKGALESLVDHLVNVEGSDSHGRTFITPVLLQKLLADLTSQDSKLNPSPLPPVELLDLTQKIVSLIRPKDEIFSDSMMKAIQAQAQAHRDMKTPEHTKNAGALMAAFDFEKGSCDASYVDQVRWWIECAECYLDLGLSSTASAQIKKCNRFLNDIAGHKILVRHKLVMARVYHAELNFDEAAMPFMELSQSDSDLLEKSTKDDCLKQAILCTVLATTGPRRSRIMAQLYSDSRSQALPSFPILEKMFRGQIIRSNEADKFGQLLEPKHIVQDSNGKTSLENAITKHNLVAASKVYNNIRLEQLAELLGLASSAEAEALASSMVSKGQLEGSIDQIEGIIEFSAGGSSSLAAWDSRIEEACLEVSKIVDEITEAHPSYQVLLDRNL